jgi:alkanesulfonate monooxygenase SsuD/methylene tetrahydromethanopterin reductase-like flavin-dependent oxidoreductase (luciferase family)
MPDYGHDLLFGTFITPVAARADDVLRQARLTDELGLDLVTIQDHPYQPAFLDTWTLLSVIAAQTRHVRVSPNVTNLPLRPPAVLARAAASLDILSGGRVELGLGAGAFWDAIEAMGGPRRTAPESIEALEEAIRIIRTLWTEGRAERINGKHYRLTGARPGPQPPHPIGIWIGAYGKRMLRLTGRMADGWLPSSPYAPPERLAEMNRILDAGAREAGRDPAAIRRLYNLGGHFSAEQLAELALTEGISGFIVMADLDDDKAIHRFAEETAPAVRELVAAARGGGGSAPFRSDTTSARLGVTPTPDDGRRLTTAKLWDESARPNAPAPQGDRDYPASGRARAQHLIDVHDHLRAELSQVRELVQRVAEGLTGIGDARSIINRMTMRQNNWTVGAYCESYCRVVTMHHTAEDALLFPQLRRLDPALTPVVKRLEDEHHAIAGVLERVDAGLVALAADPSRVAELTEAVDVLTDALLSHLSYEERQLVEPLARLPLTI